ncbi:DUF402 domain-containing protein [Streptomyces griseorubiginosus]|uniref:DUF402 domain-containing protein n=1 Tax=Streptomyces griseorubiginosus TaxID=67304 RepID=UPI00340B9EF0
MRRFETGQTVVRRDVHRHGRVWSEHALRVVADTGEALVAACPPGAETRWPALYVKARDDGDRAMRTEAFDVMASGVWELAAAVWQETELLLWKPPDTFDLTVDLVVDPDLTRWQWKDEDEYAHVRRLGIVTDAEHRAVAAARDQALAMIEERCGPFADAGTAGQRVAPTDG